LFGANLGTKISSSSIRDVDWKPSGLRGGVPSRDLGGVRDNHVVQNKPAYIAIGIDGDGEKHVLGIWLAKTPPEAATAGEGARFWGSVMADLRNRGVRDILIACCDGLAGFEDAITAAFPCAVVQRCVVHLVRNSLRPVARRDAGEVAKELRKIYTAPTAEAAFDALAAFAASPWGKKYPQAARVWEDAWDAFTPFLAFSPAVRKLLYTTNSIESLNYQLRKVTKARGHFPGDDAVVKLLWLAIINIEDKRARERLARRQQDGKRHDQPARLVEGQRVMGWRDALNELDLAYPGRLR
jgi:putative transposase